MKAWFRKISLLLVVLMIFVSTLSGCGSSDKSKESAKPAATASAVVADDKAKSDGKTTVPIVKEPLKLTMFVPMIAKVATFVKNYGEIESFQELEKKTNIKIEWQHPAVGQEKEAFSLIVASGTLPDMIFYEWFSVAGGPEKALKDGVVIELNDLIEKNAPNLKKHYAKWPEAKRQALTDSGKSYMFPQINDDPTLSQGPGLQIRQDWLDKIGKKAPTTLDEWYEVWKQFKAQDMNENGKPDEIPFMIQGTSNLMNMCMPWGIGNGFYLDKKTVKFGPVQPAYKDFVVTLNKWYKEGLIDPDFASTDSKMFNAKVTGNIAGSFLGSLGGHFMTFTTQMMEKDKKFKLAGMHWPKGPAEVAYGLAQKDSYISTNGVAITSKNKNVLESVKWLDYQYTDEISRMLNWGIEGKSYTVGSNGEPKYTEYITKNGYDDALTKYAIGGVTSWPSVADGKRVWVNRSSIPGAFDASKAWAAGSADLNMPNKIVLTPEEGKQFASIMNDINTFINEKFAKFVMGSEKIENFDSFVDTIKKMKIDEAIKMQQAAYDRYMNRK